MSAVESWAARLYVAVVVVDGGQRWGGLAVASLLCSCVPAEAGPCDGGIPYVRSKLSLGGWNVQGKGRSGEAQRARDSALSSSAGRRRPGSGHGLSCHTDNTDDVDPVPCRRPDPKARSLITKSRSEPSQWDSDPDRSDDGRTRSRCQAQPFSPTAR